MSLDLPAVLRRHHEEEDGVALFLALLAIIIMSGLSILFLSRTVAEQRASGVSRNSEIAIHAGEAAAEEVLSRVNVSTDALPYITTDPGGAPHPFDATSFPGLDDERAWAIDQAEAAVAMDPEALLQTREGEAYGIRPVDPAGQPVDVIFGVGFVPAFGADNVRVRVVKYQIAQDFFTPGYALLAGGDLDIVGGGSILAPGCAGDATLCDADVHVNGDLDGGGEAEGRVSVSGGDCSSISSTGGCFDSGDGVEDEVVPDIEARDFYSRFGTVSPWYDLCPDGTVRLPTAAGPCDGSAPVEWSGGTAFNGWTWQASQNMWRASNSLTGGTYYVYGADAIINGTAGTPNVSVFVERDPSRPTTSGTLTVGGGTRMNAAFPDVQFVVDADIKFLGGGGTELGGFVTAREQMDLGGTVHLDGALIIQDVEDSHPEVTRTNGKIHGNFTLDFRRDLAIDLSGVWTITYWNEI